MATVLVTGATGHAGPPIATRIQRGGFRVRALVRSPSRFAEVEALGWEPARGDLADPDTLSGALDGVTFVVHCAAVGGPDLARCQAINMEGTRALARLAIRSRVRRFVHVSTVSVHGGDLPPRVDEESPLAPMDPEPYCATKARAEIALAEVRAQGLETVILRPGMITHTTKSQWGNEMVERMRSGGWPKDMHPDDVLPWVHTLNLAEMAWLALTHPAAANETFLAVDRNVSLREFFGPVAQALGRTIVPPARAPQASECHIGKLASKLGYVPVRSFEETVAGLVALAKSPPR